MDVRSDTQTYEPERTHPRDESGAGFQKDRGEMPEPELVWERGWEMNVMKVDVHVAGKRKRGRPKTRCLPKRCDKYRIGKETERATWRMRLINRTSDPR